MKIPINTTEAVAQLNVVQLYLSATMQSTLEDNSEFNSSSHPAYLELGNVLAALDRTKAALIATKDPNYKPKEEEPDKWFSPN